MVIVKPQIAVEPITSRQIEPIKSPNIIQSSGETPNGIDDVDSSASPTAPAVSSRVSPSLLKVSSRSHW